MKVAHGAAPRYRNKKNKQLSGMGDLETFVGQLVVGWKYNANFVQHGNTFGVPKCRLLTKADLLDQYTAWHPGLCDPMVPFYEGYVLEEEQLEDFCISMPSHIAGHIPQRSDLSRVVDWLNKVESSEFRREYLDSYFQRLNSIRGGGM